MMNGKFSSKAILFIILLVLLQSTTFIALADKEGPQRDYTQDVADGKFTFVMLAISRALQNEEIRSQYPQSGLYRNNGSTDPLWTIDWYSDIVIVSSDGEHLVRVEIWPRYSDSDLVLAFYRNGEELNHFFCKDLVSEVSKLPHTVSHFQWVIEGRFDEENKLFWLETFNEERHTFDITTGSISEYTLISQEDMVFIMKKPTPSPSSISTQPNIESDLSDDTNYGWLIVIASMFILIVAAGWFIKIRR